MKWSVVGMMLVLILYGVAAKSNSWYNSYGILSASLIKKYYLAPPGGEDGYYEGQRPQRPNGTVLTTRRPKPRRNRPRKRPSFYDEFL